MFFISIYLYSLFSKNDISSVKIGMEISKIYSESLDTSEDVDYFLKEFLDQIPDIDSNNFLDDDVSDEFIDDDSGIIVTDENLDYLFYLTGLQLIYAGVCYIHTLFATYSFFDIICVIILFKLFFH